MQYMNVLFLCPPLLPLLTTDVPFIHTQQKRPDFLPQFASVTNTPSKYLPLHFINRDIGCPILTKPLLPHLVVNRLPRQP